MRVRRFLFRVVIAVGAMLAVSVALLVGAATLALSIDWEIPEPRELLGPSSLYDRDGTPLARFAAEVERRPVALEMMSPNLRDAVIATEDHRFYDHRGVDPIAVLRAVWNNVRHGSIEQGGSTLTQQYVKLSFTGGERTLTRKVREAVISLQLEKEMSKDEILEAYLNRVYLGEGAYGAEAAALTYFDVHAADLTLAQAATIASVIARPSQLNPRRDPVGTLERRDRVLDEMADHGFRGEAAVAAAKAEPLGLAEPRVELPAAPHVVEEIRRQMLAAYGPDLLYHGNLEIRATLDLEAQFELERRMVTHLPADAGFEPASVALDPASGDVLAVWSGRDFTTSQVDLALVQDYGRPSGSAFKVFALAAALEEGYTLDSSWAAPPTVRIGDWTPSGGGCGGRCTLLQGTVSSVNTVYAQVAEAVGSDDLTGMAVRLGVRSTMREHDLTQVLGTASVTPLDMASAFGTLANDGVACPARVVLSVRNHDGRDLPPPDPRQPTEEDRARWEGRIRAEGWPLPADENLGRCYRAVAPGVARRVNLALSDVVARGTGRRAAIGRPQAGKTRTTQNSTQVWFVGYTPDLSLAVMVSHRDRDVTLRNLPGCGAACYGGELPARIWADIATGLLEGVAPREFPEPGEEDARTRPARRPPRGDGGNAAPRAPAATTPPAPTPPARPVVTPEPLPPPPPPAPTAAPEEPPSLLQQLLGPDV